MREPAIILASSSPFRRELLSRLYLNFDSISPNIDESIHQNEEARSYVSRLAQEKAAAIAHEQPQSVVIGSDQCALLNGEILGKPGNHENALIQLQNARSQEVVFFTGLSVQQLSKGIIMTDCIEFRVGFRDLSDAQLENYLKTEKPYNCAGSFKSEGYGITLFSYMSGNDPTALIGLPLIRLTSMLEQAGIKVV
jgi:septum formation protein